MSQAAPYIIGGLGAASAIYQVAEAEKAKKQAKQQTQQAQEQARRQEQSLYKQQEIEANKKNQLQRIAVNRQRQAGLTTLRPTVLTGPLGIPGNPGQKTLLGQ